MIKRNKIFKTIGIILLLFIMWILWKPFYNIDKNRGFVKWHWSGLSALFDETNFGIKTNYYDETHFGGFDGPYIFESPKSNIIYQVTKNNKVICDTVSKIDSLIVNIENTDNDSFYIHPTILKEKSAIFEMPNKLIAISDIEGNFNGFYSFLVANKVINEKFEWIFGNGHLVLLGDFVDRGTNVTQVLWLINKMEGDAMKSNGKVHFILGNLK